MAATKIETTVRKKTASASRKVDTAVRGVPVSPRFLAFLIALLLLAGVVALVEDSNKRAAWALVSLLLVGVLLADAGRTLVGAAQIINRLRGIGR